MVTGSIPTEKLPQKSHDVPTKTRRTLVRNVLGSEENMPSTSSDMMHEFESLEEYPNIEDLRIQLNTEVLLPWTVETDETTPESKTCILDCMMASTISLNTQLCLIQPWNLPYLHLTGLSQTPT